MTGRGRGRIRGQGSRGQPRPRLVTCRCRSYCTTFNPTTQQYEGGQLQSRSTRDNHTRDDEIAIVGGDNLQADQAVSSTTESADNISRWVQQTNDEIRALLDQPMSSPAQPFVFRNKPQDNGPFIWPIDADLLLPHQGLYSLTDDPPNRPFLSAVYRLIEIHNLALQYNNQSQGVADPIVELVLDSLGRLNRLKEVEWAQQRGVQGADVPFVNTEIHYQPFGPPNPTQRVAAILSLVMENIFFTSRRALRTLLGGSRSLIRASGGPVTSIPKDPRSGSYQSRLDPVTRQFVVCVSCHKLYPFQPGDSPDNERNPFITHCNNRRTPASEECNTPLWKQRVLVDGRSQQVPARKYHHQDLKSWVGRLLSRRGMESIIDDQNVDRSSAGPVHDIWSSDVFKNLKGPSGEPFFPGPGNEGRLVFSLSVDSFNPFHMKTAKQTVSSTGIWMVLLNLPQHLRYLHENMYVAGIIPGPDKPSKEDIYPYINLVLDDLLEFWYTGVRFSRTEQNIFGRLYRAMLVPLICDMLAARQVIGFASATSHNFCTFCDLDIDDVDVLDQSEWPPKDQAHIRRIACLWRDAATPQEQDLIFDSFAIRWSPLHRLPYWDFIRYTVVDPMHALDLNLLQNHIRTIFQIDTRYPGGHGLSSHPATNIRNSAGQLTRDQRNSLEKCVDAINSNVEDLALALVIHPRSILYKICVDNSILGNGHSIIVGTKWILASNITIWRQGPNYHGSVIVNHVSTGGTESEENEPGGSGTNPALAPAPESEFDATTAVRVMRHLLDRGDLRASRTKAYTQGTATIFAHICGLIEVDCEDVDRSKRNAKSVLFEKIVNKIDQSPESYTELEANVLEASRVPGDRSRPVLGIDIMEAIWADMRQTQLPSWITPAPPNWGTTQRGKLSADNWRVICTIHLPITLIRLWEGDDDRKRDILSHFMDLVSAVRIANMRITSPNQIDAYNHFISRYTANIKELFPDQSLKPTHHAALHIGDMLGLFGPNHSHSGPHYERYINFFHQINTNSKIGQLEHTLLRTSARSANIRAILVDDADIRNSVMELVTVMDNIHREDARGFRLASLLDPFISASTPRSKPASKNLQPSHKALLCDLVSPNRERHSMPDVATFLDEVCINGVCYGTSTSSRHKDSCVIFQNNDTSVNPAIIAAITTYIFHYTFTTEDDAVIQGLFFVTQELVPVEDLNDPYRHHPFGGFLSRPVGRERIFRGTQVKSHFAMTRQVNNRFDGLIHVLPVDRLMLDFEELVDETRSS